MLGQSKPFVCCISADLPLIILLYSNNNMISKNLSSLNIAPISLRKRSEVIVSNLLKIVQFIKVWNTE